MDVFFIRHGKTAGNLLHRYIGTTDEPLCPKGIEELHFYRRQGCYPAVQAVYASPKKRCIETARLLYPDREVTLVPGLEETNFGLWENKNYSDLSEDPAYQNWIDSGGTLPFPRGESREEFCTRCAKAWENCAEQLLASKVESAAFVVHGGTIMAIFSQYTAIQDYYHWQAKNGLGFMAKLEDGFWRQKKQIQMTAAIGSTLGSQL